MKEDGLVEAKFIMEINQECDRVWGHLKDNNLSIYIDKVLRSHQEKGLSAAVIVVLGISPARVDEITKMLREKKFVMPTEIRIGFLDGSDLKAVFGKKAEPIPYSALNVKESIIAQQLKADSRASLES
ncbi:MAG: hypothetical protein KME54_28895 [Tolypothrix brevis GSE-NOS-MK-07-07A]|nr:hypothetical protein [Tolypothrix brevis GSE-NOS-MK-07-07A]